MKHLLIILAVMFVISCNQPKPEKERPKVKHSKEKMTLDIPGKWKKDFLLEEYVPKMDLKFRTEKGLAAYKKAKYWVASDTEDSSFLFITEVDGKKFGRYRDNRNTYNIGETEAAEDTLHGFACATPETNNIPEMRLPQNLATGTKCALMYSEWDYDFYLAAGSNLTTATNQIQGILAQVQWLYDISGINASLDGVYIHTTQDQYNGGDSYAQLMLFKDTNKNHLPSNNHLGILCAIDPGGQGGIASTINGLCTEKYKYAYADISYGYNVAPTYSWTPEVIAHELGHLLGSPHTHSCTWPGGAIDGCGQSMGYNEGTCAQGVLPTNGGTVMSYCHLTSYGINFNNGFGVLPANACNTAINGAPCLQVCDSGLVACTDTFEANNQKSMAHKFRKKANLSACLPTGDSDWYKFSAKTTFTVTITNLPSNCKAELWTGNTLLQTVTGTGTLTLTYNPNGINMPFKWNIVPVNVGFDTQYQFIVQ